MLKASHVWIKDLCTWEATEETSQGDVFPFISFKLCSFEKVLPHRLLCQMMTIQSVSRTWLKNLGRGCTILVHALSTEKAFFRKSRMFSLLKSIFHILK